MIDRAPPAKGVAVQGGAPVEQSLHHHNSLWGVGCSGAVQACIGEVVQMGCLISAGHPVRSCGPLDQEQFTWGMTMRPLNADTARPAPVAIKQQTQELWAEHASAIERRDPQGVIDALMAIAELHGLLVDRAEVTAVPGLRKDHSDAYPR
jgi:hypothetical protein